MKLKTFFTLLIFASLFILCTNTVKAQNDCPSGCSSAILLTSSIANCSNCYFQDITHGGSPIPFSTDGSGNALLGGCLCAAKYRICVNCSPNGSVEVNVDGSATTFTAALTSTQCR